ncbi:exported hypothetical protein [uncultured Desulfovibrio sp.]|uniref:Uncharacterized protein n=1 Tax=uncultured Desulfovibrio sp. TaxID=167968 RepID=A0A212L513_9BACT|nr:exported hypothetical protein [uncultured Desulfovibrio sp.]VZH33644.1 conserved protein of unknown function [Desulfovibrio sp. 86]
MASQRATVRLARVILSKVPPSLATWAHLWTTTLPTPPAPMIRIFAIALPSQQDRGSKENPCGCAARSRPITQKAPVAARAIMGAKSGYMPAKTGSVNRIVRIPRGRSLAVRHTAPENSKRAPLKGRPQPGPHNVRKAGGPER